ncbi:hypothetical protein SVAN01_10305 [Stagonosporopsis vannaccii]|nr:hypothetical protein SVAN01_10305 [Stagonosporopsis vannaccii]
MPLLTMRRLDTIPSQSSIAQFVRSGQAAFGNIDIQQLENRSQASGEVQKWMLEQVRKRLAAASQLPHDDLIILRPLLKLEYTSNVTGVQFLYPELSRHMKSNLACAVAFTNGVLESSVDEVPQAIKDDLLRGVAQDMSTVSIDMRDHEAINRQLAAFEYRETAADAAESPPLAKLSSPALGLFMKHLYGLRLFQPVESMLTQLRSEMNHALIMDLHLVYVPFLQELIALMLIYGIPMKDAAYSDFFESVLQNYLQRFVGQEKEYENLEHRSWRVRADAACGALESFDHSYFREILGDRYDSVVLPVLRTLQSDSHKHNKLELVKT